MFKRKFGRKLHGISHLIALSLLISSCKSSHSDLFIINPNSFIGDDVKLSLIADSVSYIQIDDSIFFTSFKYLITSNSVFISARDIGILQYNMNGKLIRRIGKRGRGPDEFNFGMNFTVDRESGSIYILDTDKIMVYSGGGTFVRRIGLNDKIGTLGWGSDIEIFNSLLFLPNSLDLGNSKFNWVFLDTLGEIVRYKKNSLPSFKTNIERGACIYKFNDRMFYYNFFNDTVFTIFPDLSSKAAYLFYTGEGRWPREMLPTSSRSKLTEHLFNSFQPFQISESKNYIFIRYAYQYKSAICLINKHTKECRLALKYENSPNGEKYARPYLLNDLDGGIPLRTINYFSEGNNEYLTSLVSALEIKNYLSTNEFKNSIPKYAEKKLEFERLANSVKETDNPVLVLVRLKK